jgi:hypothetical protein
VLEATTMDIAAVEPQRRVRVTGQVRSIRVRPWADVAALECRLVDATGGLILVFLGRRKISGIGLGRTLTAEGVVGVHDHRLAVLNPSYELHPA